MMDDISRTAEVFKAIIRNARNGGSYRSLIYDELGFGPEAYCELYEAGGMTITNEFSLVDHESIHRAKEIESKVMDLIENIEEKLKLGAPNTYRSFLLELMWSHNELLKREELHASIVKQYQDEIERLACGK